MSDATRRALITGITGQDGSYLAEFLLAKSYQVIGVTRRTSSHRNERIAHIEPRLHLVSADLLDQSSLASVLAEARPHEVYNLAAQSFVPTSWSQPVLTAEFTAVGVTRLLEAIRSVDPTIRFYQPRMRPGHPGPHRVFPHVRQHVVQLGLPVRRPGLSQ